MFFHGYDSYMQYAYPKDELKPLSCTGRSGKEDKRGDMDDSLGNYSLTLIDALGTLLVMGDLGEFEDSVKRVINVVSFDRDETVSVFESTIRVLGGLLSSHLLIVDGKFFPWYKNELLTKATDLAERLLPAFDTRTGLPYQRVNLRHGVPRSSPTFTCTACAGTLVLEFGLLSRLTGDPRFEDEALRCINALYSYRSSLGLMGNTIDVHTGKWRDTDSGIGAGIDSFYEYLLKSYIYFDHPKHLAMFNETYQSVQRYSQNSGWHLPVDMRTGSVRYTFVDSLSAFWPGLQVLAGHIEDAKRTHRNYLELWLSFDAIPERYDLHTGRSVHGINNYPLRPEFVESTYLLYRATRDPLYLAVGREILHSLRKCKVECGYASVSNVDTYRLEDRMDSYFLSETCKYLYLLFDENNFINRGNYIFTTEGHPLPLSQAWHASTTLLPGVCESLKEKSFEASLTLLAPQKIIQTPQVCDESEAPPTPFDVRIQGLDPSLVRGIQLAIAVGSSEVVINHRYFGFLGLFGPEVPLEGLQAPLILAEPLDACSPLQRNRYEGKVVLALRGKCTFIDKAFNVEDAGGVAVLISNAPESVGVFPMSLGEEEADAVAIPAMMITFADAIELAKGAIPAVSNATLPNWHRDTCALSEANHLVHLKPKNPEGHAESLFLHVTIPLAKKVSELYAMRRVHIRRHLHQIFLTGAQANFVFEPKGQLWATIARSKGSPIPQLPPGSISKP